MYLKICNLHWIWSLERWFLSRIYSHSSFLHLYQSNLLTLRYYQVWLCFDVNIILASKIVKSFEEIFENLQSSLDLVMTTMIFVKNLKPFFALASLTIMNSSTSPRLRKNRRFQRFSNFASVEIKGQIYMTPQDFLENIVFDLPKPRIKRQVCSTIF